MLCDIYVSSCAVDIKAQIEACHTLDSVFYAVGFVAACKLCLRNHAVLYSIAYYDLVISVNVISVVDLIICVEINGNGSLANGKISFKVTTRKIKVILADNITLGINHIPINAICCIVSVIGADLNVGSCSRKAYNDLISGNRSKRKFNFTCLIVGSNGLISHGNSISAVIGLVDLEESVECDTVVHLIGIGESDLNRSLANGKISFKVTTRKIKVILADNITLGINHIPINAICCIVSVIGADLNVGSCSRKAYNDLISGNRSKRKFNFTCLIVGSNGLISHGNSISAVIGLVDLEESVERDTVVHLIGIGESDLNGSLLYIQISRGNAADLVALFVDIGYVNIDIVSIDLLILSIYKSSSAQINSPVYFLYIDDVSGFANACKLRCKSTVIKVCRLTGELAFVYGFLTSFGLRVIFHTNDIIFTCKRTSIVYLILAYKLDRYHSCKNTKLSGIFVFDDIVI